MSASNRNDEHVFDAILKAALEDAMLDELDQMPSNEELNQLYASEALDKRVHKLISSQRKRTYFPQKYRRMVATAAIVLLVVSATLMSVEASRVRIINAFLDWQEGHVNIDYSGMTSIPSIPTEKTEIITPDYIPDGFIEKETQVYGAITDIVYVDADGVKISFSYSPAEGTTATIDTEYHNYELVDINGAEGHLFIAHDLTISGNTIYWALDGTLFELTGHIDHNELVKIAESVHK